MEVGIMKFIKRWPLILVSFLFLTNTVYAGAGFLVEPYLGYGFQVTGEDPALGVFIDEPAQVSYNGFDIGARIGFRMDKFLIGVDGDYMSFKAEYETGGTTERREVKKYQFGGYAGIKLNNFSLRATWYFTANWEFREDGGSYRGDGWGVGAGYKFWKYIAVNLDYRMFNYDTGYGRFEPGEIILAVSLPFDLGAMGSTEYDDY